jgi:rod shape-determining protein MreD
MVNGGIGLIIGSFMLALLLQVFPLPYALQWGRPEWLSMVLIYWVMAMPHRIGVGIAWMLGLLLDGVEGALLGQNALALAVVAYITLVLHQRIRVFAVWQQAFVVFVLIGLQQLLCNWTQGLQGGMAESLIFLLPALVSALLWPGLLVLLRGMRRRFGLIKPI